MRYRPSLGTSTRRLSARVVAACLAAGVATAAMAEPRMFRKVGVGGVAALLSKDMSNDMSSLDGLVMRNGLGVHFQVSLTDRRLALTPLPSFQAPPVARRPDMLSDGIVTRGGDIAAAWLTGATDRYRHGVLGDAVEASGLRVALADGRVLDFRLPADSVFEDRLARPADMDGDGDMELLVVRSYLDAGAALAVLDVVDGGLRIIAEAPAIGTPNRWLNPVGAADFDGDGRIEAAVVITPHIGGTLTLYRLRDGRLRQVYAEAGFSNHAIGSRVLDMSAIADVDNDGIPDIAVPDARRRDLRLVGFAGGAFREIGRVAHPAPIVTAIAAADLDGADGVELVYGLADRSLVAVKP